MSGSDHHIRARHVAIHDLPLHLEKLLGHFLGVTTLGLHVLGGFYLDKFGAKTQDLFLDRGANVRNLDHRSQTLGGGDGLEPGHPRAQDHHSCRPDGSGGGHEHGEELGQGVRGHEHRLVPPDVGLG